MADTAAHTTSRLVFADVAESPSWRQRVAELATQARPDEQWVLRVPPPRLDDSRALVAALGSTAEVEPRPVPVDARPAGAGACAAPRRRRPRAIACLPADAAYAPPDWAALRTRRRCLIPWLPRYDLPRDRHREQPLGGLGWLATGDLLDLLAPAPDLFGAGFHVVAARIHRQRLPVAIASARVAADEPPEPPRSAPPRLHEGSRILAVVPHFRCERWLDHALASLAAQTRPPQAIVVVDDGSPRPPTDIVARFPGCTLLVADGNHGPYRVIQQVIADTDYDGYLFQDADDWSAHDRLELLLREAGRTGADLVGCQEGRWQDDRSVVCLFPADANRALAAAPVHALLHPTSLVSRALVIRAGGYATGLRFFGDAEFLWRSHHCATVRNIPFVSYFRQARPDSLTGSADTGHRSPARLLVKDACKRRFWDARQLVARGERPPLTPYRTAPPVALRHVAGPQP